MPPVQLPKTYSNNNYTVTINSDRSIKVRSGDWVSKYASAIWGDPMVNWDKFHKDRKGNQLDDPNKITVGQTLYLASGCLPGESNEKPKPKPIDDPVLGPAKPVQPSRVEEFFRFMKQWLCPVTDWEFKGSNGLDLSASFLVGNYTSIDAQRPTDPEPFRYHAIGLGLGIGLEDLGPGSISLSPPDFFPDCMSGGWIGKFPTAGRTLSPDEICGNYLVVDFSMGFGVGVSFAWVFFGFNLPPQALMRTIGRYLRGTDETLYVLPSLCQGSILMGGPCLATPNLGASLKIGSMHRVECITG